VGHPDWAFDVVGTLSDSDVGGGRFINGRQPAYLEEARALGKGTVQHFNVAISDPKQAVRWPMRSTAALRQLVPGNQNRIPAGAGTANMQSIGDMNFLIRAVECSARGLLFATATMMIQSVRERNVGTCSSQDGGFTIARCSCS